MKIQLISTCYQCRYGDEGMENRDAFTLSWCHEASREIPDMDEIPHFCPLEDAKEADDGR